MAINVDELIAEVEKQNGITASVVAFVNDLKKQLAVELTDDPAAQAKVNAVFDDVMQNNQALSAAIQASPSTP